MRQYEPGSSQPQRESGLGQLLATLRASPLLRSVAMGVAMAAIVGAAFLIYTTPSAVPEQGVVLDAPTSDASVLFSVEEGDTAAIIGARLQTADIIDNSVAFERLARIIGAEASLVVGEYEFAEGTSVLDAITRIRDGLTSARIVTLREGLRVEEVALLLEEWDVISVDEFMSLAGSIESLESDPNLLTSRTNPNSLEGYIFPATYSFSRSMEGIDVLLVMLEALSTNLTPELRAEAQAQGLSIHDVLTIASIVEREAVLPEEREVIASVFLNRIDIDMPLQADPTVQYALTERPGSIAEFGYWKSALSLDDLQYESPYNTYVVPGMPPGPIANPGIESIEAVIRPAQTNYLFFVARGDGSHVFAETFDEHLANIDRYQ